MRILVSTLTPYPSGTAHAVHVTATAQGLVNAGHQVLLVSAQRGPGWPEGPERPDTSRFRIQTLAPRDYRGQSLINGVRLRSIARRTRPDVAFADDVRSGLALALSGVPVLVELHSMQFLTSGLGRESLRRLVRSDALRGIVTISQALREDFLSATTMNSAQVHVLPEAARTRTDAELSAEPPGWLKPSMRQGSLQVGYSGSLYAGRGGELMLDLARRLPDIDLHVLGGPDAEARALRTRGDCPPNFHVHGLRPPGDAERLQAAMDVLLAPYARSVATPGGVDTSRWMSPMKIFEYLASGRAIVCSDLPVLREVLEHDVSALLVRPDDPEDWVNAIVRLRNDPSSRSRLGARGRLLHAERFTWEARTLGLMRVWGSDESKSQITPM